MRLFFGQPYFFQSFRSFFDYYSDFKSFQNNILWNLPDPSYKSSYLPKKISAFIVKKVFL